MLFHHAVVRLLRVLPSDRTPSLCLSNEMHPSNVLHSISLKLITFTIWANRTTYRSIVRSVLEYACPVWAALPKYLEDVIESVQKRALRIVLPNCHYDDALIQSGITALSQRREEACINFIKRDCLSSPVLKPLIPCVSIDRPYCLRSGECVPVRLVPNTKRFADFCTIKFQDQL